MPDQLNRAGYERISIRLDWRLCFIDKLGWLADWRLRARFVNIGCALTTIARHRSKDSKRWHRDASACDQKRKPIVPPRSPASSRLPSSQDLALRRLRY